MAIRKVYRVNQNGSKFVDEVNVEFKWSPGFAVSQKQKNIKALHEAYKNNHHVSNEILEISSKSEDSLGVNLSAFNLTITTPKNKRMFSVESAFQSSKKFELGGPYVDILNKDSRSAKKDTRLSSSGKLVSFKFFDKEWPLEPKTLFYDWLYMNALDRHVDLVEAVVKYDAFTDIEFNHNKSINCQAHAAALYVSLFKRGFIEEAMSSPEKYVELIKGLNSKNTDSPDSGKQIHLF